MPSLPALLLLSFFASRPGDPVRLPVGDVLRCETHLGSRAIGRPHAGRLERGLKLPAARGLHIRNAEGRRTWGTEELAASLVAAARHLRRRYPDAPPIVVGDLSRHGGGPLPPHVSHQSGRDVDLGYFVRGRRQLDGFRRVNRRTLDADRTWAVIEGLVQTGWVERIFIDRALEPALHQAARRAGHDRRALRRIFARFTHEPGHDDHFHVRIAARAAVCGPDDGEVALARLTAAGRSI